MLLEAIVILTCAGTLPTEDRKGIEDRIAGYLHRYLDEKKQASLWASREILPGLPKRTLATGLLADILTGPGLDFLEKNQARFPEYLSTDPANLFALSRLFAKMRVEESSWKVGEAMFRHAESLSDTGGTVPVLLLAANYESLDWMSENGPSMTEHFFFCAAAPSVSGEPRPITLEFSEGNVLSNRVRRFGTVSVTHRGRTRTVAFPGKVTLPDFDARHLVICSFPIDKDTLTTYLDLSAR